VDAAAAEGLMPLYIPDPGAQSLDGSTGRAEAAQRGRFRGYAAGNFNAGFFNADEG